MGRVSDQPITAKQRHREMPWSSSTGINDNRCTKKMVKMSIEEHVEKSPANPSSKTDKSKSNNENAVKLILQILFVSYFGLGLSYPAVSLASYALGSSEERVFVLPSMYFIPSPRESPAFELLWIYQFVVVLFSVLGQCITDSSLIILVFHAKSKTANVCQRIKHFSRICGSVKDRETVSRAARALLDAHEKQIQFFKGIRDIFSLVSLSLAIISSFIIASLGFTIIRLVENDHNYASAARCLFYIICALSGVGSYCIAGEFLTHQNLSIENDLRECSFYNFQEKEQNLVRYMLVRAQNSNTLEIGKFGNLSLFYLTMVLKRSFSYLSLLRATQKS